MAAHPFLIGLAEQHIRLLTDCALLTRFLPGQVIFRAGETANRFYLIETGCVVLESDDNLPEPIIIDTIGTGDLLGWSWIFPPHKWHFSARAVEPTTAIFFYGTILREYCDKDPSLGYELFKRMSEVMTKRLQRARARLIAAMKKSEMSTDNLSIQRRLAGHPFLKGVEERHLKVLAQSAMPAQFEKDQLIFKAGEPANGFYLIESGAVALEGSVLEHGPITTDTVHAGEPLGWSWLFPPYQ